MMQGRFVAYIYKYKNGVDKEKNSGFVKVQRMSRNSDKCRIHINIKDVDKKNQTSCRAFLYGIDSMKRYFNNLLCEFVICHGQGESRMDISWKDVTGDMVDMDSYAGLIVECEDGAIYASSWLEDDLNPLEILSSGKRDAAAVEAEIEAEIDSELNIKNASEKDEIDNAQLKQKKQQHILWGKVEIVENEDTSQETEEISENKADEEKEHDIDKEYENAALKSDEMPENHEKSACEIMIETKPRIQKLDDKRFFDCVKIEPQDIGRMSMQNWQLGVNSFLSHGFFNYKHLLLGKVKFGRNEERYVIGVPGVYSNKEKYLANMFGFTTFIPVKSMRVMTGSFGYWIVEVID